MTEHGRETSIRWFHGFGRGIRGHGWLAPLHPVEVLIDGGWLSVTPEAPRLPDDWQEWSGAALRVFCRAASKKTLTREEERAAFLIEGALPPIRGRR